MRGLGSRVFYAGPVKFLAGQGCLRVRCIYKDPARALLGFYELLSQLFGSGESHEDTKLEKQTERLQAKD